jgi:hypothetical protein
LFSFISFLQSPLLFHYALVAADQFHHSEGRYPGSFLDSDASADTTMLVRLEEALFVREGQIV